MFFDKLRKKDKNTELKKSSKFDELRANIISLSKEKIKYYKKSNYSKEEIDNLIYNIDNNLNDLNRFIGYYEDSQKKLNALNKDSNEYKKELENSQRWYYEIIICSKLVEFYRPNNKNDQLERNEIYGGFSNNVLNLLGQDSDLRFHGTPIYFAKDIIKTKSISGSADRYDGYIRSTDSKGTFSASDVTSLSRTITFFTDLGSDRRCLPCGVLFVLNEKENDKELREAALMNNIDFNLNPEQLVSIISTEENIGLLTKWCIESNIDPSCIHTFSSYIEYLQNNNIKI